MTYDVKLPLDQTPRYPNRCVACERENPETNAEVVVVVSVRTQSISSELADTVLFGTSNRNQNRHVRLKPPACSRCCGSINRAGLYAIISQYAFPLLGVAAFCAGLVFGYSWLGIACLISGILWPAIRSVMWPPALGATASGINLVYEFRSKKIGKEFEEHNLDR